MVKQREVKADFSFQWKSKKVLLEKTEQELPKGSQLLTDS